MTTTDKNSTCGAKSLSTNQAIRQGTHFTPSRFDKRGYVLCYGI